MRVRPPLLQCLDNGAAGRDTGAAGVDDEDYNVDAQDMVSLLWAAPWNLTWIRLWERCHLSAKYALKLGPRVRTHVFKSCLSCVRLSVLVVTHCGQEIVFSFAATNITRVDVGMSSSKRMGGFCLGR